CSSSPGSAAYFLPATPNGRGVAAAWEAASEGVAGAPERVGLLLISGEEAVADPRVRALAERSDAVAAVTMFSESVRGWTHVVLPGTSYLERHGTMVNLEGRVQRLRQATEPPGRADLDWIAELAARFGVTIELPGALPASAGTDGASQAAAEPLKPPVAPKLRLTRYRALFSGSAVERVPQLQFQRPEAVIELSPEDAKKRSIAAGETVTVLANGTSVELRARINRRLVTGAARAAEEHVRDLPDLVEIRP
ncbi:MAG: molybdopterin-dependent oxidoreductase, partial [Gaiellaceae bacterium]